MHSSNSLRNSKYNIFLSCLFCLLIFCSQSTITLSQVKKSSGEKKISRINLIKKLYDEAKYADRSQFRYIPKKPGHYTAKDWRAVIDSTWGEGLPTSKKLEIFDLFWNLIDDEYPSFFNLNVNWDSLYNHDRPEVEAGVSRGRFYAIMCKLTSALEDNHTMCADYPVAIEPLKPGIPLFVTSFTGIQDAIIGKENSHFGAGLEPMPDSSLFVYKVLENHPLNLEVGDIVLGYDGIPWKYLYKELLEAELPFSAYSYFGTSKFSRSYGFLTAAGENWHSFDTIDVVKYSSGDTIHLPTSLLNTEMKQILLTSQIQVPGVPFPDVNNKHHISWGIMDGLNIGYIYQWSWLSADMGYNSTGADFKKAIQTIMNDYNVDGLIIDSRNAMGGWPKEYAEGLNILFSENQDIYQDNIRADPNDHYSMQISNKNNLKIDADNVLFDKPIAVLIGPESMSASDLMPFQMRYHPMCKVFGLPTNGAFGSDNIFDLTSISGEWGCAYTKSNIYLKENPNKYLTHLSIPPDEEVWLTQESVVKGEDAVVNKAVEWIQNKAYAYSLRIQPFVPPDSGTAYITAQLENPHQHQIKLSVRINNFKGLTVDSIPLFNDGLHNDAIANDQVWGNEWQPGSAEQNYYVDLLTFDSTDSTEIDLTKATGFTTAGPLTVDSIPYNILSYFRYAIKPLIKNKGRTAIISDIQVKMFSDDPWVMQVIPESQACPDISPGDIKSLDQDFVVNYDSATFPGYFNLKFEISSNGVPYWTDSMHVIISPTGIDKQTNQLLTFNLEQNFPNPFNPTTNIKYSIASRQFVELMVFNVLGQQIETLVNEEKPAGNYQVEFNAANLPSGVYFYRIKAGSFNKVRKMLLIK